MLAESGWRMTPRLGFQPVAEGRSRRVAWSVKG
jgi:hypothetical protein